MEHDFFPVLTITGRPLVKKNGRPIFVNPRTGKRTIGKRQGLKDAEDEACYQLREQWGDRPAIDYPVRIAFLFWLPGDADLSNLYELPQDALQAAGVLKNDLLIRAHDGSRKFPGHKLRECKTEIHIRPYV